MRRTKRNLWAGVGRVGFAAAVAILLGSECSAGSFCVPRTIGTIRSEIAGTGGTSLDVEGTLAVVQASTPDARGKLEFYDLSFLPAAHLIGEVSSPSPWGWLDRPRISGSIVVAFDHIDEEWLMRVFDVSDPRNPRLATTIPGMRSVGSSTGSTVVALGVDGSMVLIDLANPDEPRILSRTTMESQVSSFILRDRHVYALVYTRPTALVRIFDVGNPESPRMISHIETEEQGTGSLQIAGDFAFVAGSTHFLSLFDISVPESPRLVSRFRAEGDTGPSVFVTAATPGLVGVTGNELHLVDVSDPAAPREVGRTGAFFGGFFVSRYLLGSQAQVGRVIVDLAPCLAPPPCAGGNYETIVPVVAHTHGKGDVLWTSDLEVVSNFAWPTGDVTVTFLPDQGYWFPEVSVPLDVAWFGYGQVAFRDVLVSLLGIDGGFGALRICSPIPIAATSTMRARNSCGNETSTTVPAIPLSRALRPQQGAFLFGLEATLEKRTNFGFVNLGSSPATVDVYFCPEAGPTGYRFCYSNEFTIAPNRSLQVNQPFWLMAFPEDVPIRNGFAWIRRLDAGPIIAWSSTIDEVTGEMTFRLAEPEQ